MEEMKNQLCKDFELTEEDASIFLRAFTPVQLKKHEVFIEEGEICHKIGFIEKGLLMCVYNKDGDEVIDEFSYENNFIADYYSFLTHTPTTKEVRAIEESLIHVVTRAGLENLSSNHSFMDRLIRKINEKLFLRTQLRLKSLMLDSATKRYESLVADKPNLAQRIPQYLIASYLNVKPETVSRIRKKNA